MLHQNHSYFSNSSEFDDEVALPDAGLVRGAAIHHHHDPGEGGPGLLGCPRGGALSVHGRLPGLAVEAVKTLLNPLQQISQVIALQLGNYLESFLSSIIVTDKFLQFSISLVLPLNVSSQALNEGKLSSCLRQNL